MAKEDDGEGGFLDCLLYMKGKEVVKSRGPRKTMPTGRPARSRDISDLYERCGEGSTWRRESRGGREEAEGRSIPSFA